MESALFENTVLRVPGAETLIKIRGLWGDVLRAVAAGKRTCRDAPVPDAVRAEDVPSTAALGTADRVLAEIDQDGYAFAVRPEDEAFFNRRKARMDRLKYRLHVVLRDGYVVLRKPMRGIKHKWGFMPMMLTVLDVPFVTETACMLRLRHLDCVPRLRDFDVLRRTVYIDYVQGVTLQQFVAERGGKDVLDIEGDHVVKLDESVRAENEIRLFRRHAGQYTLPILEAMAAINSCGVAPLDVKLGNVLVGARTGAVYWIDFERAHVETAPRHELRFGQSRALVEQWFGGAPGTLDL